jgi:hypothetical protein
MASLTTLGLYQKNEMNRGITKSKLKQIHPELAKTLDDIESVNKKEHYWFFANYNGKYKTAAGISRSVSLGAVIDVINMNGYEVEIKVKNQSNQTV